jgi:hypothetical protein
VRVRDGCAAARAWVIEHAARTPGFRGAFASGFTAALAEDSALSAFSDVDVMVVRAGSARPPKLGKFPYRGVLLDVTYLPWDELASVDEVATSHYLAPSFSSDQVIVDPTGHLARLREEISA